MLYHTWAGQGAVPATHAEGSAITPPIDAEKLKALASTPADELGESEEDVKIRFVVPFLEALGHTRLRFEHRGMDIVVKQGLPRGCTVVVETKRPDVSLDACLDQLQRYSFEERALLAVLTNGRLLRLYAPFWNKAKSFAETLLWEFRRSDLAEGRHVDSIASLLSRQALATRSACAALAHRQDTIEFMWQLADEVRQRYREWDEQLRQRIDQIGQQIAALDLEQRQCEERLRGLDTRARDKIRGFFQLTGTPLVPTGDYWDVVAEQREPLALPPRATGAKPGGKGTRPRRKPQARQWTLEDVRAKATPIQVRIFSAFVQLGARTLGLKEIARQARLAPNAIAAAMAPFRTRKEITGREPLMACHRMSFRDRRERGNLFSIAPSLWPLVRRAYADLTRPAAPPPKAAGHKRRKDE